MNVRYADEWYYDPSLHLGSSGPTRVAEDPDENFVPRPVGFTAKLTTETETEPQLWDGDSA